MIYKVLEAWDKKFGIEQADARLLCGVSVV